MTCTAPLRDASSRANSWVYSDRVVKNTSVHFMPKPSNTVSASSLYSRKKSDAVETPLIISSPQ